MGQVSTPHGVIQTPVFMPVGTQASVKSSVAGRIAWGGRADHTWEHVPSLFASRALRLVAQFGGLARVHGLERPILTDSGGFQVFSMAQNRKIDDEGVTFKSHLDGSTHRFTPEMVMRVEEQLGADIIMVLDECTPHPSSHEYNQRALPAHMPGPSVV